MKKIYRKIALRDGGRCRVCGRLANDVHHIVFRSHSGSNDERNLICLCRDCHTNAHADEKLWRDKLLSLQYKIYGHFEIEDVKK